MRLCFAVLMTTLVLPGCSWLTETDEKPSAESPRKGKKGKAKRKSKTRPTAPDASVDVRVRVLPDGRFEPSDLSLKAGDTVQWVFESPDASVVPIMPGSDPCSFAPVSSTTPTGPTYETPAGLFALGPDGTGWVPQAAGSGCSEIGATAGELQLCEAGAAGESLAETWSNPALTGVFIRLRWKDVHTGPDTYDWTTLDREIDRAVAAGKQVSIGVKAGKPGTPDWLFTSGGVERWSFQDWGSAAEFQCKNPPCCGFKMDLGSPADPEYRRHYFGMLTALGQHLRQNAARYQAVVLLKPSGLNLISHENRLPKRCEAECPCNTETWAKAGYTPEVVQAFYREQFSVLSEVFPDRPQSYMLIQAGFPQVVDRDTYLRKGGGNTALPKSPKQTEAILKLGHTTLADRWVVQHNGLGPLPQDRTPAKAACPNEGKHPATPPFGSATSGCPSRWVLQASARGIKTGLQTNNEDIIHNLKQLDSTLRNLELNSDATFVEIYEERAWQALRTEGPLDPEGSGRTLKEWNEELWKRAGHEPNYTYTFDGTTRQVQLVSAKHCKAGHIQRITVKP